MNDENRNSGDFAGRCPKTGQFMAGNPGRQPGTKNRATKAAEKLFADEAENISRVCIEHALAGDTVALKLALERICPPLRESTVEADLPALDGPGGVPAAIGGVWRAVGDGTLSPGQGERLTRLVAGYTRARELEELETRIRSLEAAVPRLHGMSDADLIERARDIIRRKDGTDGSANQG